MPVADLRARLRELREMRDEGLLEDDEFREMKAVYLRQHRQLGEVELGAVSAGLLVPPGYSPGYRPSTVTVLLGG